MNNLVLRNDTGAVARLTMNSPKNYNALSDAMIESLTSELRSIADDPKIRVVILAALGKAFCAGHDLKEMTAKRDAPDKGATALKALFDNCSALMQLIPTLPQPVIAEVHGVAAAAGCQLVASCDLAIASENVTFGVNGVNIGLFCSTPMVALSRNINRKAAFEMLTTGSFISAQRAVELGLINQSTAPEDLEAETLKMAQVIASKLSAAVKVGKQAFYEQLQMPLDQAYAYTSEVIVENMLFRDTEEGIKAFLEKRTPDWAD
ncbi:enoyl-CoA hydratase [Cochlodiniinecator piscidefendens]|uniref:enoyl-CoA hydratase n=1 Tax=Cochlodiniinecator piscidefendens TaxID=2715756 RepID=UPI00140CEF07|nr:enoyl-CoA hydratase [Cochlodiniinecator piscidefendens]